jgi:Fe2+ or Zn2+ uptake regulation protein
MIKNKPVITNDEVIKCVSLEKNKSFFKVEYAENGKYFIFFSDNNKAVLFSDEEVESCVIRCALKYGFKPNQKINLPQ